MLGDIENVLLLSVMTSGKYFSLKMSPIYASLLWFEGYEKLELCFRKGTFIVANFLCSGLRSEAESLV